jgi:hypothetical protein
MEEGRERQRGTMEEKREGGIGQRNLVEEVERGHLPSQASLSRLHRQRNLTLLHQKSKRSMSLHRHRPMERPA